MYLGRRIITVLFQPLEDVDWETLRIGYLITDLGGRGGKLLSVGKGERPSTTFRKGRCIIACWRLVRCDGKVCLGLRGCMSGKTMCTTVLLSDPS